jgi:hypothetical protein
MTIRLAGMAAALLLAGCDLSERSFGIGDSDPLRSSSTR